MATMYQRWWKERRLGRGGGLGDGDGVRSTKGRSSPLADGKWRRGCVLGALAGGYRNVRALIRTEYTA